jgi:SAM-dependent methyltransferase
MDLKEQEILGSEVEAHWYYRAKARALTAYVGDLEPETIVDVGAGSGFFCRHLLATTGAARGVCVDPFYETEWSETVAGKPIEFRRAPFDGAADLYLFMDVLEHVDDDRGLLLQHVAAARSGARVLVSVPAFQFLWSGHDVFLEHRRRYRLDDLMRVVESAGLAVERGSYYFGAVFPLAAALRLGPKLTGRAEEPASQMRRHSPAVNGLLRALCTAELPLLRYNRLAGLTVFCLARKP